MHGRRTAAERRDERGSLVQYQLSSKDVLLRWSLYPMSVEFHLIRIKVY